MRFWYKDIILVIGVIGWLLLGHSMGVCNENTDTLDFDPYVVTVSRFEESSLNAPASISVINYDSFMQEGVPSIVASLRTVPGVDIQQAGMNRYLVAVRGFNNAFESKTYTMVDNRESYNPAMSVVAYSRLPIDMLDIERVEVVRGPSSALYGPGVAQGVIHFITKDPFDYPGTSVSAGIGEQSLRQISFRHAQLIGEKLAFKLTGAFMESEDWKLSPDDPHDASILAAIEPDLKDRFGNIQRIIPGRDYEVYSRVISGELQYKFTDQTRLKAFAGYSEMKNVFNATLGEIQVDGPGMLEGQVQLESGNFYAQVYGITEYADGDNWFYREGNLMYGRSYQIDVQARYKVEIFEGKGSIAVGADYKKVNPNSKGTIYGRFEDEDKLKTYGAYLHTVTEISDNLDFTASGRLDYVEATKSTTFSPRLALVYQISKEHTFRLTYNRAASRPTASDYFGDMQVGSTPAFQSRWMGSARGWSFPDPLQTSSFFGPGRDSGIGMANARVYGALAGVVSEALNPGDPEPLRTHLLSRTNEIGGISEGIMTFRSSEGELLGVVPSVQNHPPLRETISETFEIGYKGVIDEKFVIGLDAYYTKMNDFLFPHVITPFVEVPGELIGQNLAAAIRNTYNNEDLAQFGITVEHLADAYGTIAPAFMLQLPPQVGLVETTLSYNPDSPPEMVIAFINAGAMDYYGADLSVEAFFNDNWSAYANFSWTSENFFDDASMGLKGSGYMVSMNSPKEKFRAGLTYRSNSGLIVTAGIRYTGAFFVADGVHYNGLVEKYTLVDCSITYDFSGKASGLNISLTVQNILDNQHREYIGFPTIGRLASCRLVYEF